MKLFYVFLIYALVCIGCQNNSTQSIVVEKKGFETLSDSLLSQMPGVLLCTDKHLFWSDPFNSPFAHFIDKKSGKEVSAIGQYGQGPNDFSTPWFAEYKGDTIFVWDLNEDKQMFISLDSDGVCSLRHLADRGLDCSYNRIIQLSGDRSIRHNPESIDHPFSFICGKDTVKCGKDPIKGDFSADSKYNCFQGEVCYNRNKDLLVYCPIKFEYMAIYKFDGKKIDLKYEYAPTSKYTVSDGDLKILDGTRTGAKGLCFTANYIATLEYDYDNEDVTFVNSNPILHTSRLATIFKNYPKTQHYPALPLFYEGWDDESSSLLIEMDNELFEIIDKLKENGLEVNEIEPLLKYYESHDAASLTKKLSSITAFKGIGTPSVQNEDGTYSPDLNSRYFTADFPYGLDILLSFGRTIGLKLSHMEKVSSWYHTISGNKDSFSLEKFGIKSTEDIIKFYK